MISQVIGNSSINTKMHAKLRGTLKREDYDKMVNMKSVPEAAEFLKHNTRFEKAFEGIDVETIHRGRLEARLKILMSRDLQSFMSFTGTSAKFFLSLFAIKNEIVYLKLLLRMLLGGKPDSTDEDEESYRFEDGVSNTNIDFTRLANAASFDEFAEILRPTIYFKAFRSFIGNPERQKPFELEMALDLFYRNLAFSYMSKYLSKDEEKTAEKTFGTEIDLDIIMFIIRSKMYYKFTPDMIYPYVRTKNYRLSHDEITAMTEAQSDDALMDAVRRTAYGSIFKDNSVEHIESKIDMYSLNIHRRMFHRSPYSIEAIVYYIKLKEIEIKNIIMTIEGIRYGVEPEMIKSYLIGVEETQEGGY